MVGHHLLSELKFSELREATKRCLRRFHSACSTLLGPQWNARFVPNLLGTTLLILPMVSLAQSAIPRLLEKAPDTYIVEPGDTLWDISALFLNEPWRWPEL